MKKARFPQETGLFSDGEGGIRTHGGLHLNGFRDRPDRPLRHLSRNPSILALWALAVNPVQAFRRSDENHLNARTPERLKA
jgi:hypothetical protein